MKNKKEIEETIRHAFEVDRLLPRAFPNKTHGSILGLMVTIPDTDRSYEDIAADPKFRNVTQEDLRIWNMVMFDWLPILPLFEREIIRCRCRNMGWKRIARHLVKYNYADRELYRTTLWRSFQEGIDRILVKFCND